MAQDGYYLGKGAAINTVNGDFINDPNRTYWTIKGDTITEYLDRKRTKFFKTYILGITEDEDWKIKWSFKLVDENKGEYNLIKRGVDTFTDKSYKITYFLYKEE